MKRLFFWDAVGDSDSDVLSFDEWVNLWPIENVEIMEFVIL